MFKKVLASLGVGSAKVDTQLEKVQFVPGETAEGKVVIQGGEVDQTIDRIQIFLMTEALREVDDKEVKETIAIEKYQVTSQVSIAAKETKEIPLSLPIPKHAPTTLNRLPLWFETGLEIPVSLDPKDRDYIQVDLHPYVDTVLHALERELDFRLHKVDMEYSKRLGYVQEFEFIPGGEFRGYLDELETVFFVKEDGLQLNMQVDRRARGLGSLFAEALEMDESHLQLFLTTSDLGKGSAFIANKLGEVIRAHSGK